MELRKIKLQIKRFLETETAWAPDSYSIHIIDIIENGNDIIFKIFTQRPGFIIGRMGSTILALEKYLQNLFLEKKVKIEIKEYDPFFSNFNITTT